MARVTVSTLLLAVKTADDEIMTGERGGVQDRREGRASRVLVGRVTPVSVSVTVIVTLTFVMPCEEPLRELKLHPSRPCRELRCPG